MRYFIFLLLSITTIACTNERPAEDMTTDPAEPLITDSAGWVIDQAITRHGGEALSDSEVKFVFRDRTYSAKRAGSTFTYQREYTNKEGREIREELTNGNYDRTEDGIKAKLTTKDSSAYANSLNSVMYFAFLPYFLDDPAVQAEYHGITNAFGFPHHELLVTFTEDGGGKDFEDEYAYWFAADDFRLNYLAYNFLVNGGGARFREAYNARELDGIRLQDYINYKPTDTERRDVLNFDELFRKGALDTLSRIELETLTVTAGEQ